MPKVLSESFGSHYAEVCFAALDADPPVTVTQSVVVADATSVTVRFLDGSDDSIDIDVYWQESETAAQLDGLDLVYDGEVWMTGAGMRVSVPTDDEEVVEEIPEGKRQIRIFMSKDPRRVVAFVDPLVDAGSGTTLG